MSMRALTAAAGLTALPLLASPALAFQDVADPGTKVVAEIEQIPCDVSHPPGESIVCLMAWVPMSYDDAAEDGTLPDDAPRIGVHLILLENFLDAAEPNPLVMIAGGPGQASSDFIAQAGTALELRRSRSIVLFDQRGTGRSVPNLTCADADQAELDPYPFNDPSFEPEDELTQRLRACHDDFVAAGIDLRGFDTRSAARDLLAIRRALGLEQWNLHGTSYGSRLALDAMRVDPEGIRSVVLNSVLPTTSQADPHHARARADLFEQLFADCADDEACAAAFPDLREKLERIAAHLADAPMVLQLREPASGQLLRMPVGWNEVLEALWAHMAFTPSAAAVPLFIDELADVVAGRLSLNDDEIARIFQPGLNNVVDGIAIGLHLSVKCREDFPSMDRAAVDAVVLEQAFYYPDPSSYIAPYDTACEIWDVGTAPAGFHDPVSSDIPVLILAGDADPLTPIAWAHEVAAHLPRGQFVSFRGMAHDIFGTLSCARVVTANFLDAPEDRIDASCANWSRPVFEYGQF